jgi:integrase
MSKRLITDLEYRNIKPTEKDRYVSAGDGLFIRVRAISGAKSFRYSYRIDGKQKWVTLTTKASKNALPEARKECAFIKEQHAKGIDLALEKKLTKERNKQAQKTAEYALLKQSSRMTVNSLFEKWERLALKDRKDKGTEVRRMFEKDVLPSIGNLAVEDIKKSHIVSILNNILERGVNRMAKVILSLIRQMFRFAQDQDIIESDPTSSIRKSKIGGKDIVRDRVLSEAEIKELQNKLPNANLLISTECALWIMLSTLCRIGELCKAKWSDIDFDEAVWNIPKENSKNGKAHKIYLSEFSIKQFKRIPIISNTWIFPNQKDNNNVCEKSITKQVSDRQLPDERIKNNDILSGRSNKVNSLKLSGGKFTPHDLRRTGATLMGNLNIRPNVIEKCLNHIEQNKITRTYQHQTLVKEQELAWKLLGERLNIITSTSNVIGLELQLAK